MPVNTLVVIAIAVLVMLGLIAMYMAGTGPFSIVVEMSAKGSACNELNSLRCDVSLDSVELDYGDYKTLDRYCKAKYAMQYPNAVEVVNDDLTDLDNIKVDSAYTDNFQRFCKSVICGCTGVVFNAPQ